MELVVRKTDLLRELQLFQGIVERKNTIPILANVLMDARTNPLEVSTRGITKLTPERVQQMARDGKTVRLISRGTRTAAGISLRELIKEAQNPLPDLVSVPIQNNFNIGYGPYKGLQDGVNIQPVIPMPVTPGLNVITRVVAPLIFNPKLSRDIGPIGGLGDVQVTPFLSPSQPSPWVWGIGPIIQLPTHSNPTLGNNNLGLGPSVALLRWTVQRAIVLPVATLFLLASTARIYLRAALRTRRRTRCTRTSIPTAAKNCSSPVATGPSPILWSRSTASGAITFTFTI